MTVVCAHQPNFLPGVSVLAKVLCSDVVIWMDTAQFPRSGFVNRNRFEGGTWMTVPFDHQSLFAPINQVEIQDPGHRARRKIAKTLEQKMGSLATPFSTELMKPYKKLVALNYALLDRMLYSETGVPVQVLQSMLTDGYGYRAGTVVTDDEERASTVSGRLAALAYEAGATTYLSGSSGRKYLDEEPFEFFGIKVEYFEHHGPNPTGLQWLLERASLRQTGPYESRWEAGGVVGRPRPAGATLGHTWAAGR